EGPHPLWQRSVRLAPRRRRKLAGRGRSLFRTSALAISRTELFRRIPVQRIDARKGVFVWCRGQDGIRRLRCGHHAAPQLRHLHAEEPAAAVLLVLVVFATLFFPETLFRERVTDSSDLDPGERGAPRG